MRALKPIGFSTILASSIHDMKNSLGMLLESIEDISDSGLPHVKEIQYEARRVNNDLIRLLVLYKMDEQNYRPLPDEVMVRDMLEECYLKNKPLFLHSGISLTIDCDEGLQGYCDRAMVSSVLENVMTNALRYSRQQMRLAAYPHESGIIIEVNDDGVGFPQNMLVGGATELGEIDYSKGNTGLGIYFAHRVATLHCNGEQCGSVSMTNGGALGGGRFQLVLP